MMNLRKKPDRVTTTTATTTTTTTTATTTDTVEQQRLSKITNLMREYAEGILNKKAVEENKEVDCQTSQKAGSIVQKVMAYFHDLISNYSSINQ